MYFDVARFPAYGALSGNRSGWPRAIGAAGLAAGLIWAVGRPAWTLTRPAHFEGAGVAAAVASSEATAERLRRRGIDVVGVDLDQEQVLVIERRLADDLAVGA